MERIIKSMEEKYLVPALELVEAVFTDSECAENGKLDTARWESYRKLKEEAVDRDEMMRRKNEWAKGVAKFSKQRNKEIW